MSRHDTAFCGGIESEAARLRPLLERCQTRIRAIRGSLRVEDMDLLDDLRRELGKEAGKADDDTRDHEADCECWRCTAGRNAEMRDLGMVEG